MFYFFLNIATVPFSYGVRDLVDLIKHGAWTYWTKLHLSHHLHVGRLWHLGY